MNSLPEWFRIGEFDKGAYKATLSFLRKLRLNTVCIEANCPNRYECFSHGTATFMILGNICTRNCRYCNVATGKPQSVDKDEPKRIARAISRLGLRHVVITSVSRDDLQDGGALHFVRVINEVRKANNSVTIELLIPDFNGNFEALSSVVGAKPDVINHNIEVVKRLFQEMRPGADYELSLRILEFVKRSQPGIVTKSGLMVGLGETTQDVTKTMQDLAAHCCDILTIGQYLQPSDAHAKVVSYYKPEEFQLLRKKALSMGFKQVLSAPLVRSSYKAAQCIVK